MLVQEESNGTWSTKVVSRRVIDTANDPVLSIWDIEGEVEEWTSARERSVHGEIRVTKAHACSFDLIVEPGGLRVGGICSPTDLEGGFGASTTTGQRSPSKSHSARSSGSKPVAHASRIDSPQAR